MKREERKAGKEKKSVPFMGRQRSDKGRGG
jgi:hypothetical protein